MTTLEERQQVTQWLSDATTAGARLEKACEVIGLSPRTLQRWQLASPTAPDQRTLTRTTPSHALTEAERANILAIVNSETYGHLPPTQIVPRLADLGCFVASESTIYRLLRDERLLGHRRSERPGPEQG